MRVNTWATPLNYRECSYKEVIKVWLLSSNLFKKYQKYAHQTKLTECSGDVVPEAQQKHNNKRRTNQNCAFRD